MCKDQELHRGAVVKLERLIGNFRNREHGGMYILGKALSIKLKEKKCMHSFLGLQKQALRIASPLFYIKLFYLQLIDMSPNEGKSWHFGPDADVL